MKAVTDAGYFLLLSENHVTWLFTSTRAPLLPLLFPSSQGGSTAQPLRWQLQVRQTRLSVRSPPPHKTSNATGALICRGTESCLDDRRKIPQGWQEGNMSRKDKEKAASSQKQDILRTRPRISLSAAFKPVPFPLPSSKHFLS